MNTSPSMSTKSQSNSHVRWIILALLFWVSMCNFLDRSVFGNIAPEMWQYLGMADKVTTEEQDLYWQEHSEAVQAAVHPDQEPVPGSVAPDAQSVTYMRNEIAKNTWAEWYWNMNTAFTAAYALSMLILGRLMDIWGLRWGFAFASILWMAAEMLHAVAPEIGAPFGNILIGFVVCRVLLGLGEGAVSPAVMKAIAEWFPKKERALATGVASGASSVGAVLVPWLLPYLLIFFTVWTIGGKALGWRGVFILTGLIDAARIVIWIFYYKRPERHDSVGKNELAYILSDSGDAPEPNVKIPWRRLLPLRQTWAFICAKSLTDGFWWFYCFASPDFFARRFDLGPKDRALMLVFIWLISAVGAVAGGWLSKKFMDRGWSLNKSRKMTLLVCGLAAVPVFFAAITNNQWISAILIMLAAAGHQAWGANVFCLASDMFPKRTVASVVGIGGVCSTGMTMLLMFVIGQIVKNSGGYFPIFFMASGAYLVALLLTQLLSPRMDSVDIDYSEVLSPPAP